MRWLGFGIRAFFFQLAAVVAISNPPAGCEAGEVKEEASIDEHMWLLQKEHSMQSFNSMDSVLAMIDDSVQATTTCSFTIDNVVDSVYYNGNDITASVSGTLGDWWILKSVSVTLTGGAYLVIAGYNWEGSSCSTGGFAISCDNGVTSDSTDWESYGSGSSIDADHRQGEGDGWGSPCTSTSGFYLPGFSVKKLYANDADKYAAFRVQLEAGRNSNRGHGPTIQLKYTQGLCMSMASGRADAGCSGHSCQGNANSDATLQTCSSGDNFQLFHYDETTKLLQCDAFGCVTVSTSSAHGSCEPFTLQTCSSSDARQQFTTESSGGSTIWRNTATNLAIDVNSYANTVDNWVWACPGSNSAKYFDPITL